LRTACQAGRSRCSEEKGFGFIKPDGGSNDVFFHVSALREGEEIIKGAVERCSFLRLQPEFDQAADGFLSFYVKAL
jgi:cold shock CspA family protein